MSFALLVTSLLPMSIIVLEPGGITRKQWDFAAFW
jgi:hypothetical protein